MHDYDRRRFVASSLALAAGTALAGGARAQTNHYPSRALRIVVPGAPGGATDLLGRWLSADMSRSLGQPVIVDNKPGASGIVAAQAVLAQPADGYTLYMGITSVIQLPALMRTMPVDFARDFAPVSLMALGSDLLVLSARMPATSVAEFVALAKSRPGQLSIGSYGNGTSSHLHGELFKRRAGVDLIHVPFKGAAPLLTDLLGGQVDAAFIDQSSANTQLHNEKLRFLARTGTRPFKPLPRLPSLVELGYAGFESNGFMAMFVPSATPPAVTQRLSTVIAAAIRSADVSRRIADTGMEPVGSTPDELRALMARDAPRWARIIKDADIRID